MLLDSTIVAVTVYTDKARVLRRGSLALTGNEQELTFENLPPSLEVDSLRVSGSGAVNVRITGVRTERQYHTEAIAPKIAELNAQIETLEQQKRGLQDRIAVCQLQQASLQQLSSTLADPLSRSLARQQFSLQDIGALFDFVGARHGDTARAIADLQTQQKICDRQLTAIRQQLQQIRSPRTAETLKVIVAIEPTGAGQFDLDLSYVIYGASWTPLYDIQADSQRGEISLAYLAEVIQKTGEDWLGVALTLSTAKTSFGALPPKLQPWYLNAHPSNAPLMRKALRAAGHRDSDFEAEAEMPLPATMVALEQSGMFAEESYEAEIVTAAVQRTGGVVTFDVGGRGDIPSDGNPHKVTLFHQSYPVQWQYVAIPKLVSFAYLQVAVQNPETGVTLLSGTANIFRDGAFVGKAPLENISPGQDFTIDLGIDEGFQLKRDLVERKVNKKLVGGQRQITYSYRLKLVNLMAREAQIKVTEQVPVSRHEKLKVKVLSSEPKIELGEMGKLEWKLKVPAKQQQTLAYQFLVEYPPDWRVPELTE